MPDTIHVAFKDVPGSGSFTTGSPEHEKVNKSVLEISANCNIFFIKWSPLKNLSEFTYLLRHKTTNKTKVSL